MRTVSPDPHDSTADDWAVTLKRPRIYEEADIRREMALARMAARATRKGYRRTGYARQYGVITLD